MAGNVSDDFAGGSDGICDVPRLHHLNGVSNLSGLFTPFSFGAARHSQLFATCTTFAPSNREAHAVAFDCSANRRATND